jgi:hypothetical protein
MKIKMTSHTIKTKEKRLIEILKELLVLCGVLWVLFHEDPEMKKKELDNEYLLQFEYHIQKEN